MSPTVDAERESLVGLADLYTKGVRDTFTAIFDALLDLPEEMTARAAGEAFKKAQPEMEARFVAVFDQALARLIRRES